jgi:LppP/LprE lipoprotein
MLGDVAAEAEFVECDITIDADVRRLAHRAHERLGRRGQPAPLARGGDRLAGLRVNALCPGPTLIPGLRDWLDQVGDPAVRDRLAGATLLDRLAEPEEIAAAALFLHGNLTPVASASFSDRKERAVFRRREDGGRWRLRLALLGAICALAAAALIAAGAGTPGDGKRSASVKPSGAQIEQAMWRTVLVALPLEHFVPAGQLTTISDGSGGALTAEVGAVMPTTDGDGQLVFFWHNRRFVGWDSTVESMIVLQLQPRGPGNFQVTYANYRPSDPACCPSLIPVSVDYRWNGHHFLAEGDPPSVTPTPGRVRLLR